LPRRWRGTGCRALGLLALSFALLPPARAAAAGLVVLAKSDDRAVLVDPASFQTLARIPTGEGRGG
jgi:hypothetical protein